MAMSPRLLRPIASGVHPEAAAWRSAVVANGGSVSALTLRAVGAFCAAIDAAGIRDRFYRLSLMCGENLNAALVPLYRGPSRTGTQYGNSTDTNNGPFVSGDYSNSVGLTSDSASKFLQTGLNLNAMDAFTTGHIMVCFGAYPGAVQYPIGAVDGSDRYIVQIRPDRGTWGSNVSTANLGNNVIPADSMTLVTRTAATEIAMYANASTVDNTIGTSIVPTGGNAAVHIFRTNSSLAGFPAYVGRIRAYSIGRGISAAQNTSLYNAMKTLQDALGRTQA